MVFGDGVSFFFSDLKEYSVLDINGNNLGSVGDALFQIDSGMIKLHSLILYGGWIEEKLEDIKLQENIDPIIPIEVIIKEDPESQTFTINLEKNNVKATTKEWKIPSGLLQFSQMKKVPIYDKNGITVGSIIDIFFHANHWHKLIIGGNWLDKFLKKIKGKLYTELILPISKVTEFSKDNIQTNLIEEELERVIDVDYKFFFKATNEVGVSLTGYSYEKMRDLEEARVRFFKV
jgi:sporulation protein YlmC with PRC-barrel domain